MAYVKNTWVDQQGQVRYTETEDDGYKIFTANYEEVTEIGTPVNADNMNHIEQGIYDCYAEIDTKINAMLQALYPIGSLYISTSNTNPLENLFGTWELVAADRVLQGSSNNHEAGTTIAAGLPNITGTFKALTHHAYDQDMALSGMFKNNGRTSGHNIGDGGTWSDFNIIGADASRSSSIYGNSTTVQPSAYVVNIWRRTA